MLERLFPQQADDKLFVEDVFSTYLYTGNGSTQTITNGIDLAGKGGMLWRKSRGVPENHFILDTTRGIASYLESNTTSAAVTGYNWIASFNSDGFTNNNNSANSGTYASWTFREAPKFFDVVTTTTTSLGEINISHTLGVTPGCVFIKRIDSSGDWTVWHRSADQFKYLTLNSFAAETNMPGGVWVDARVSTFYAYASGPFFAANAQYVVYLFAHDPSADGIIQCGSYTAGGSPVVTLGWEPQWLMIKNATTGDIYQDWYMFDNMRKLDVSNSGNAPLRANTSGAEGGTYSASGYNLVQPRATGFVIDPSAQGASGVNNGSDTYIYVAIRRGPMRTPTLGTSVFNAQANLSTDANKITTGFVTDWFWQRGNYTGTNDFQCSQRLTQTALVFNSTAAEGGPYGAPYLMFDYNDGFLSNLSGNINPGLMYGFRRAPGFMDVVCYTGTGVVRTVNHNLGVVPELMIVKKRDATTANGDWAVWNTTFTTTNQILILNSSAAQQGSNAFNSTQPTASVFTAANNLYTNLSGSTYVAYLFASAPGVSKVGSYTGNGSSQTINCAFTTGARFVLIKRTDNTGDWWVWDSARGIVAGNDPALRLNSNAAETTSIDSVDPDSTGFVVNQDATTNINVNGGTYIYLAIA